LKAKPASAFVAPSTDAQRSVLVWDSVVRICHLALIAGVLGAWLTRHWPGSWHELLGYGVALIVVLRCIWGFIGTQPARFRSFVLGPRAALRYLRELLAGQPRRYLGHNPLGAWMIVALLLNLTLISVTGWMFTTDRFFGYAWVINTHLYASYALFAMVALHLLGVAHASVSHGENLVASMIHGHKRAFSESTEGEPPKGQNTDA
jgi:cytochrome b